jgi:hypothetical protein
MSVNFTGGLRPFLVLPDSGVRVIPARGRPAWQDSESTWSDLFGANARSALQGGGEWKVTGNLGITELARRRASMAFP